MSTPIKPICFIAMAFDHDDTDSLYENQIRPVLKRNNITPIIINRRESNDDINIQIIEQLKKANFCITDLTYTRPSVYYEAGFAQRAVPVIYTVRKDHLKPSQPEDLRVHFDLQQKPIIGWENPKDLSFSRKLESRIKATFLKEWNKDTTTKLKLISAASEFEKESVTKRLGVLRNLAITKLRKIGFSNSTWSLNKNHYSRFKYTSEDYVSGSLNYVSAKLRKGKIIHYVTVQSFASITVNILEELYRWNANSISTDIGDHNSTEHLAIANHLILSLKSITPNQIEKVFTGLKPISPGKCYSGISNSRVGDFSVFSTYFFLTGIKSPLHFEDLINNVVSQINEWIQKNKKPEL